MARPSATSNRIDPKLKPVNRAPNRSPQAKAERISAREANICVRTAASVSCASCWFNNNCVLGVLLLPKALAAANRTALSVLVRFMAACAKRSSWLMAGLLSAAVALSSNACLLGSGSANKASAAFMRVASSGLNNCNAANAESISLRIRLLLTTSWTLAGRGTG